MPDLPVEPAPPDRYPAAMEARVAVLEQIARSTSAGLEQIMHGMEAQRAEIRVEMRTLQERVERRLDIQAAELRFLAVEQRADFRWLMGVMLAGFTTLLGAMGAMLGVMAHGFHWL